MIRFGYDFFTILQFDLTESDLLSDLVTIFSLGQVMNSASLSSGTFRPAHDKCAQVSI